MGCQGWSPSGRDGSYFLPEARTSEKGEQPVGGGGVLGGEPLQPVLCLSQPWPRPRGCGYTPDSAARTATWGWVLFLFPKPALRCQLELSGRAEAGNLSGRREPVSRGVSSHPPQNPWDRWNRGSRTPQYFPGAPGVAVLFHRALRIWKLDCFFFFS